MCETHYKNQTEYNNQYNNVTSCKKTHPESGKEWPDHDLCRNNEEGLGSRDPAYSISRSVWY